jgi:hypothetical protein
VRCGAQEERKCELMGKFALGSAWSICSGLPRCSSLIKHGRGRHIESDKSLLHDFSAENSRSQSTTIDAKQSCYARYTPFIPVYRRDPELVDSRWSFVWTHAASRRKRKTGGRENTGRRGRRDSIATRGAARARSGRHGVRDAQVHHHRRLGYVRPRLGPRGTHGGKQMVLT